MSKLLIEKRAMLEILEDLFVQIENAEKNLNVVFRETEELRQSEKWNRETKTWDLLYNEDGTPKMEHVWKDVEISDDELPDLNKAKKEIYKKIREYLEKLI